MYIPNSPWGQVDYKTEVQEGVFFVSTPGHGGFMVHRSKELSDAAKNHAEVFGNFYCFEEDCMAKIVVWELKLFNERTSEEDVKRALVFWVPEYVKQIGESAWLDQYPQRN